METTVETDVLIVGAGPTGLMLAIQLARRGVRVQIVDRRAGPSLETRALGVQARTLEIYAQLGLAGRALELGRRGTGANLWAEGRHMARVPLGEAGAPLTPYPYLLILGQDDNERIMGGLLRAFGVTVQWQTELTALVQTPDAVTATLALADGTARTLTAAWLAGGDGAHSRVRELTGIAFPGEAYEHVFFVADTQATGNMVPDEVNVYLWRRGFYLMFPMRGADHWRIVGILPPALRGQPDAGFGALIPQLRTEAGADLTLRRCSWYSTYRIHHRHAARFRERRCFLLGDAAHVHSPVGAQGMNTGLQDAYNLGWKLALVVAGHAPARLLDSYEAERLPVARRLLATTDRAFRYIVADGLLAALLRTRVLARLAALAMRQPRLQRLAFRTVAQIGIHYRSGPLAQTGAGVPADAPRAGDRFPWLHLRFAADGPVEDLYARLDDTRFTLIVLGQPAPAAALPLPGTLFVVLVVPDDPDNAAELARARLPQPAYYLLRPDGHIGCCGVQPEAAGLAEYLRGPLGLAV